MCFVKQRPSSIVTVRFVPFASYTYPGLDTSRPPNSIVASARK